MSFSRTGLRKPVKIVWRGRNVASTFRNPVAACYSPGEMHAQTPGPHRSHYNSRTNGRWIRARPSPLINIPRHEHTHVFATPDALRANYTARYCHRVSFHLLRGHDLRFDTIDIPTNYPRRIGKTIICARFELKRNLRAMIWVKFRKSYRVRGNRSKDQRAAEW